MNLSNAHMIRRMIPRWRRFATVAGASEVGSAIQVTPTDPRNDPFFLEHIRNWRNDNSVETATELVSYGLIVGALHEVSDAAAFVITNGEQASSAQTLLAKEVMKIIGEAPDPQGSLRKLASAQTTLDQLAANVYMDIAVTKRELAVWPRNAILWVELSRLYAIVGHPEKSAKAMTVALALARNNRFVVRSAARLAVHHREPDRALNIIRGVSGFHRDPWLLASEVAISCIQERTSRRAKDAVAILKNGQFGSDHITELAGAVGTLEITKGSTKKARDYFRQSLIKPNDNALAQAEWAAGRIGKIDTRTKDSVPTSYEASARNALFRGDWLEATQSAFRWAEDEPFSSGPAAIGSYISAALLEDYQTSLDFCDFGLPANPEDIDVKNNKVVALVHLGHLDDAIRLYKSIRKVDRDTDNAVVLTATGGLLAFRTGDTETGRSLYNAAADLAEKRKNLRLRAMARIYLAREEIEISSGDIVAALDMAEKAFKGIKDDDKEVRHMMGILREKSKTHKTR